MVNQDLNKTNTTFGGQSFLSRVSSFRHSSRLNLIVQLLDDNDQISLNVKASATGQAVLDMVCEQLNIVEREFFGLRYQDNNRFRFWLDLNKPINKQLKGDLIFISLRFRFYPINPFLLKEDITRYQLFVQLRRDLLHGRLYCSQNDTIQLAGLILQAVLGDYNETFHPAGYVSQYKLIIKQTERLEEKIANCHKSLQGLSTLEAESRFLTLATEIETYGFDPYVVKDGKQSQDLVVGATCRGVLVFSKNQLLKHIPWKHLSKVDYTGKELRVYPTKDYIEYEHIPTSSGNILDLTSSTIYSNGNGNFNPPKSPKKLQIKFICPSSTYAKHLWRHLLSQQAFFTEDEARLVKPKFSKPRIPLFSRGSTFRCPTRKVLHEIEQHPLPPRENQPIDYPRYPLPKQISRSEVSVSSRTGTLKSVRSSKVGSNPPKIFEDALSPSSESESIPFARNLSSETLTSPLQPASSTPLGPKPPEFVFTPTKGTNSLLDTTFDSQISTTSIQTTSDEDLTVREKIVSEDYVEAPMEIEKPLQEEKVLQENYEEEFPSLPTSSSQQLTNETGTTPGYTNGSSVQERFSQPLRTNRDSALNKSIRAAIAVFLMFMMLGTFAMLIFEADNGRGARWAREIQPISSFRQIVYDPSKDALRQIFKRRFH